MKTPTLWIVALIALTAGVLAIQYQSSEEDEASGMGRVSDPGSLDPAESRQEELTIETEVNTAPRVNSQSDSDPLGIASSNVDSGDPESLPQPRAISPQSEQPSTSNPVLALPGLAGFEVPDRPIFMATASELAVQDDDPVWSSEMESRLIGEISQVTRLRATSINVECRSELCRNAI